EPTRFLTNPEFWSEFVTRMMDANIKPGKSIGKVQKILFKICHQLVKDWYAANDPDNIRHADLVALFIFNFWNATGLLSMTQSLASLGSDLDLGSHP
ncbi:MAG TPA: hypothetical protein VKY31_04180, partial [Terriglobia bacterium]|nr:hypothetical protein [Terriglobia bacterium]